MDALISIIVPVFNAEDYLEQCLRSIVKQTYTNLEILLIDDGSTDSSGNICEKFASEDNRVKVVHKKNGGVSSARNTGLKLAQGEYISFIDSDDCVDKEYISAMYEKIKKTNSDISFCRYSKLIKEKTIEVREMLPEYIIVNTHDEKFVNFFCCFFDFKQYIFGSSCRILFKKILAKDTWFDVNINVSEDLLFLLNIMLKSKVITSVNQSLYFYRQTSTSVSHSYKKNYLNNQLKLYFELEKIFDLINNEICNKKFHIHACLLCYYVISNELKFKQQEMRISIQRLRDSAIYKYFTLKNGLRIYGLKSKFKFLITWFLVKTRLA